MPTAKKAEYRTANLKVLTWGLPKTGKTEFALSAPSPLVIDYEDSSSLYGGDYDFLVARPIAGDPVLSTKLGLTGQIITEIGAGEYKDRKTLVIDPITDVLEDKDNQSAILYEKRIGRNIQELNALERTKWYAFRRTEIRKSLDALFAVPMDLILIARAKEIWNGSRPSGTYRPDVNPIVEYLMDVILEAQRSEENVFSLVTHGCRKLVLPAQFKAVRYHAYDVVRDAKNAITELKPKARLNDEAKAELAAKKLEAQSKAMKKKQKSQPAPAPTPAPVPVEEQVSVEEIKETFTEPAFTYTEGMVTLKDILKTRLEKLIKLNAEYSAYLDLFIESWKTAKIPETEEYISEEWLAAQVKGADNMLAIEANIPEKFDLEAVRKAALVAIGGDPDLQLDLKFTAEIRSTTRRGKIFAVAQEFELLNEDGTLK